MRSRAHASRALAHGCERVAKVGGGRLRGWGGRLGLMADTAPRAECWRAAAARRQPRGAAAPPGGRRRRGRRRLWAKSVSAREVRGGPGPAYWRRAAARGRGAVARRRAAVWRREDECLILSAYDYA